MLATFLTAIAGMIVITASWLAVQRQWQRHFPDQVAGGDDALAGRGGCRGCNCSAGRCERAAPHSTNTPEEGSSHAP